MKNFLIAGSSLVAVAAAGSAGAVDVTLGGSIDMGVEYGVGKASDLAIGSAFNKITLSIAAAGTTDAGLKYGGSFGLATAGELKFNLYGDDKKHFKYTVKNYTDLKAAAYNVSGGQKIDADDIVAVKINSEWKSVSNNTRTLYGKPITISGNGVINSTNVCKIAGRVEKTIQGTDNTDGDWEVARYTPAGKNWADVDVAVPTVPKDGYLPAGVLHNDDDADNGVVAPDGSDNDTTAQELWLTVATSNALSDRVRVVENGGTVDDPVKPGAISTDKFNVVIAQDDDVNVAGNDAVSVTSAQVFAGPFMSVKLRSSSTKMVIGAVCVTGKETSETAFYMDNVSKVVTASDASIYIEGGFGKLTLQTGDYAGAVSKIGDAGDQADIGADGLVAIVSGVGLLGANPYVAVDLAPESSLNSLEVLTGGTIDMGGLTAAVDIELDNADGVIGIGSWDLGLGYSMGDADVDFVIDSANAWGMKASMAVAGFGVDATIYNKATAAHKKNGLFYSVSASTDLNGFGLSLGVDQDMKPTVGLSYDVGSMNIYAGYDAADNGGKVGAKLSF